MRFSSHSWKNNNALIRAAKAILTKVAEKSPDPKLHDGYAESMNYSVMTFFEGNISRSRPIIITTAATATTANNKNNNNNNNNSKSNLCT